MKHVLIFATALCILMLAALVFINPPVPDIDLSGYEQAIEQHAQKITHLQAEISTLTHERDSLQQAKQQVRIIREQVPAQIEQLPPTQLLATFDTLTGNHPPTTLTPDSLALTPLPRLLTATIALTENPLLKQEITLLETLNLNLNLNLILSDSIHQQNTSIIAVQDTIINQQATENNQLRKNNKWLKRGVIGLGIYAVLRTIF